MEKHRIKAADIILKNDKRRANYYNYHVGEKWTNLNNYDMVIRSDFVGIDQTVECICKYLGEKSIQTDQKLQIGV